MKFLSLLISSTLLLSTYATDMDAKIDTTTSLPTNVLDETNVKVSLRGRRQISTRNIKLNDASSVGKSVGKSKGKSSPKCAKGKGKGKSKNKSGKGKSKSPGGNDDCDDSSVTPTPSLPSICPVGRYLLDDNCLPCPLGSFSNSPNASSCNLCPTGSYQDQEGQDSCIPCQSVQDTGATFGRGCDD